MAASVGMSDASACIWACACAWLAPADAGGEGDAPVVVPPGRATASVDGALRPVAGADAAEAAGSSLTTAAFGVRWLAPWCSDNWG